MIIITGATGFVGTNLIKYLTTKNQETVPLSLKDKNWINKLPFEGKAIIHLAGKAHDTTNVSSPEEYYKVNRDLTIDLFNEFLKSNIRDFFYFSSVKAVADTVDTILDEQCVKNPITYYGKSKMEAEEYLIEQKLPQGKRIFIIRPCMIHGPGNKGNLNLLYNIVEKGYPWPLASFANKRSFLSVDNLSFLVEAMILEDNLKSGIYNFSDDTPLSTNELVVLIAKVLGKNEQLWRVPVGLVRVLAKFGDILPFALNSERLKKLTESYVVSNAKIKNALGLEALPLSARDGLMKTIKSFQKRG